MDPWQQAWRTAETPAASTVHHPFGRPGGPGLWHTGKQLPAYIQNVAHAFRRKGASEQEAIERAVGVVRDWAEGHDGHGNRVHPDVQAAAARAIAEWEKLRAEAHAKRFNTHHGAPGSGHGGQFVSASGAGGGAAKTGSKKPAAHAPSSKYAPQPLKSDHPGEKRRLLAQVHADRMRIRRLEQQLHQLEHQHAAAIASAKKAAATAKKAKAATKKATAAAKHHKTTATHHHTTHHITHHVRSLSSRITALRQEIGNLRKQAAQLEARAKAL